MANAPSKSQFVERVLRSRKELAPVVAGLSHEELTFPGASGDWSVKDVIAHITWHEREMFNVAFERKLAGSDWWDLPLDDRNQKIYELNQNLEIEDVLEDSKSTFEGLIEALQTLSEEDLMDPRYFVNMPHDWVPWELFADNTYLHYEDHLPDLKNWKNKSTRG